MREPPLYRDFIAYAFECEDLSGIAPAEIVMLYRHLLQNLREAVTPYALEQIAHGVERLFHPGFSDTVGVLTNPVVPMPARCEAIKVMAHLYRDLFDLRCAPVMSHLDERGGNALNAVCYMLWDVTPINYFWTGEDQLLPEARAASRPMAEAVFSVLEAALYAENIACVESGLHGLGHMATDWPKEVNAIIDLHQRRRPNHDPRILRYADLARYGLVQ
jgi:hypothetical protein